MPLYEYECTQCRNRFEVRQRVTDDPISVCPTCGGSTRKVLHPVGVIFKGSGWYITDSRKSDSAAAGSEKSAPAAEAKTESAGDGAKAAPAAEAKSASVADSTTSSAAKAGSTTGSSTTGSSSGGTPGGY